MVPFLAARMLWVAYLTERADAGLGNGNGNGNGDGDGDCAAIAHRQHQERLGDLTADAVVRRVRRGLRRILGTAPRRQAHALTVAELADAREHRPRVPHRRP